MKGNKEPTSESVVAALVAFAGFTLSATVEVLAGKFDIKLKLANVERNVLRLAKSSCLEEGSNQRWGISTSMDSPHFR